MVQFSHPNMTARKTKTLIIWIIVGKVMSLLFNNAVWVGHSFSWRNKCLLISWLQSSSAVILEPNKINFVNVSIISPSICHEVMGLDVLIFVFWMLSVKPAFFHCLLSPSSRGSLVPLCFLMLGWCHLHSWGYWYFSQKSWSQLVIHPAWNFTRCTLHES